MAGDGLVTLGYIHYFQGQFADGIDVATDLYELGLDSDNLEHQAWGLTDQARSLLVDPHRHTYAARDEESHPPLWQGALHRD